MYTYFCIPCLPASLIVVVVVITAVQNRINGVSECARFEQHYSSRYILKYKPKPTKDWQFF